MAGNFGILVLWKGNHAMWQKNYEYSSISEAVDGLLILRRDLQQAEYGDALLHIYLSGLTKRQAGFLLEEIDRMLPGVKRAGITAASAEAGAMYTERVQIKLNLIVSEEASFQVLQFPCEPGQEKKAAGQFIEVLEKTPYVQGIGLFPSGVAIDTTFFMEKVSEEREELPFFGAMALPSVIQEAGEEPVSIAFGIGKEMLFSGFTVVIYAGEYLQIYMDYILGWQPIGKELPVSLGKRGEEGGCCVKEIDGMPAVEIYHKYLGVEWGEDFVWNVCEFPLMVRRNHTNICMVPFKSNEKGELYFSGPLRAGEKLRFSYGTPEEVLGSSYLGSERMARFEPDAVFLSLCGNRINFLQKDAHVEWDYFKKNHPQLVYCHGNFEISYQNRKGGVLNSAFVATGIRENLHTNTGRDVETETRKEVLKKDGVIPLAYRLSRFLQVISEDLVEMADKAEAANRAKSSFLSSMSHEIRTPINAVLGMDEMILREAHEEQILSYAEDIRTAGNSLLGLVNDILDFSKIEAGKMEIVPVEYEFASVLNDLVNMIRKRAEDKGLELIVDTEPEIPSVFYGDEIRLKQVVTNILTNAVKYTEKGSVTLSVSFRKTDEKRGNLKISVKDTGIGIRKEDQGKLFSAFERIEEERNRNIEGTGLGMNITSRLLAMMGSNLDVQSEYGEGSEFSFEVEQLVVNWEPIGDFKEALRRSKQKRERYKESFQAPEARVLVVDDTPMNLNVFKGLVKRTKVQVNTAESGFECLEMVREKKYDIIFLDHRMPKLDGVETKKRMETLEGNQNEGVPVIALTANAVSGAKEEYLALGFTDYLSKPIAGEKLERMMRRYLPEEKVVSGPAEKTAPPDTEVFHDLPSVDGLDWDFAKLHLPEMDLLKMALQDFYRVIRVHADRLDEFYKGLSKDKEKWNDYRILVHGMKSSAATVGLLPASGMAKILEDAAKREDYAVVSALHDTFTSEWRKNEERLKGVFSLGKEKKEPKIPFEAEVVKGLLKNVEYYMEEFDTDKADEVVQMLLQYSYPEKIGTGIKKLLQAVAEVDPDETARIVGALLEEIESS